jgi:dipeptidyl aminopeptidase/acylaminoacyl peptidase
MLKELIYAAILASNMTAQSNTTTTALGEKTADLPTSVSDVTVVPGNANLLSSGIPQVTADLQTRVMQYLNARSARLLDTTPNGENVLIATRFASTMQMHLVETPLGARHQLTFSEEPIASASFLPTDPNVVFYMQDKGGGEFYQIYRMDRATGRSQMVSDGKSRYGGLMISRDGSRILFNSTARNGKDTDVYVAPADDPSAARPLTQESGTWSGVDISHDASKALIINYRSIDDADLYLCDVATGKKQQISEADGKGSIAAALFSPDSKSVYFVTDRYSNFNELYRVDLENPSDVPESISDSINWNIEDAKISPDGSVIALNVNEEGYSRLYFLNVRTQKFTQVKLPVGLIDSMQFPLNRNDAFMISMQTSQSPSDVYEISVSSGSNIRWTKSEVGGVNTSSWRDPELVRYKSGDKVSIPAFVYRPEKTGKPAPVVIIWHGGPEGQSRPGFSPFVQMLTNEFGIAVVLPNVRGSDGYGKVFLEMDNGIKREGSLADIAATLDWISEQPDMDKDRIGIYGGSYGGYMVLATAAFFPDRIRSAVDVVGISNLVTFLENTQSYRQDLRRVEYGDERDPEVRKVLERISPLNHADKIKASLYVQQGKNDPRVPQSEAEQIVHAVRASGKPVWYLLGLNEGHGFAKKENRDYALVTTVCFLLQTLGLIH